VIAYKLMKKRKDGTLGPLFINASQRIPVGKWFKAEAHRKKGFAFRPGWHALPQPKAHTRLDTARKDRVWCRVEIEDFREFKQSNSTWLLAQRMRVLEELS